MRFLLSALCPLTKVPPFVRQHLFLLSSSSEKRELIKDVEIMWRPLSVENFASGRLQIGLVVLGEKGKIRKSNLQAKPGWQHLTQKANFLKKLFWIKLEGSSPQTWHGKIKNNFWVKEGGGTACPADLDLLGIPLGETQTRILNSTCLAYMGCVRTLPEHSDKSWILFVDDSKWQGSIKKKKKTKKDLRRHNTISFRD